MARRPFTARQLLAIQVSERTMSVLSILGSLFIMGTFLRWHYFRKPINRLVFMASFGNVMSNVATLISISAVPLPGEDPSPLCQFQGVLIQWFMMADSLWVFCMALNVMLVFFHHYNSRQLRRLEKWYIGFAYGVPFLPAFIYIVVEKVTRKRIYGPATIWCWVDSRVEWMRIAFFYAPVWLVVCLTLAIYTYTGYHIFQRRRNIRLLSQDSPAKPPPVIANPFTTLNGIERTTEISVRYTSDSVDSERTIVDPPCGNDSRSSFSSTRNLSAPTQTHGITAATPIQPPIRFNRVNFTNPNPGSPDVSSEQDDRNYRAAVIAENRKVPAHPPQPRAMSVPYNPNVRRNAAMEGNTAAWSYFKVAFLMFAALFIVWVPSTVNRLQQFINKDSPIFGLNLASGLVLPLQGFWNSMVYVSTTWPECKRAVREILDMIVAGKHSGVRPGGPRKNSEHTLTTPDNQKFDMTEDVPLSEMMDQRGPTPDLYSQMPSAESINKTPHTSVSKV